MCIFVHPHSLTIAKLCTMLRLSVHPLCRRYTEQFRTGGAYCEPPPQTCNHEWMSASSSPPFIQLAIHTDLDIVTFSETSMTAKSAELTNQHFYSSWTLRFAWIKLFSRAIISLACNNVIIKPLICFWISLMLCRSKVFLPLGLWNPLDKNVHNPRGLNVVS